MAAATSGIHAGFLWRVGEEKGAIYLTDACGRCSPCSNPKLLKALKRADQVVFATLASLETDDALGRERWKGHITTLAQKMQGHWSSEEINESILWLEKQIEEGSVCAPSKMEEELLKEITHPCERFIYLFAWVVRSSIFPHQMQGEEICSKQEELLKQKAEELGKKSILLSPDGEYENHLLNMGTLFFNTPSFHLIVKETLLSERGVALWKKYVNDRGRAWDFGMVSLYSEQGFFEVAMHLAGRDTKLLDKLAALEASYAQRLVEKICTFLQHHPNVLISAPAQLQEDLLIALTKRDIQVQGPLREAINPRGFLWQICDKTDRVVGYFLGSVHAVPRWILDRMNSKTLRAFESCDTLGVEVDVTQEGVSEALELKEQLSEEERNSLILVAFILEGIKEYGLAFTTKNEDEILQKGFWRTVQRIFVEQGFESGMDHFFIDKAKKKSVPIVDLASLETYKECFSLMQKEHRRKLIQVPLVSLDEKKIYREIKRHFVKQIWKYPGIIEMGSIEALETITAKDSPEMVEAMSRCNMEIALSTDRLIRQGKKPFSIMGAHLFTGPLAVDKLMGQMGYKVMQIICEEPRE
jgi:uncharacterized protein YbaP (TraB family)